MPSPSSQSTPAMANTGLPAECMPFELIAAMAMVKRACGHGPDKPAFTPDDPFAALHVAASVGVAHNLLPAVTGLLAELSSSVQPLPGHVTRLSTAHHAINAALPWAHATSPPGNAPIRIDQHVAKALAHADDTSSPQAWLELHGALKLAALALMGLAKDMRHHGQDSGRGETPCDALAMVCAQVLGNDLVLTRGAAAGQFDSTTFQPVMARKLLQSIRLLSDAITVFTEYFVGGLVHNRERISQGLASSLMLVASRTALAP